MPNRNSRRPGRPNNADSRARSIVDEATGDTLFEQPLVDDGESSAAVDSGQTRASKGGKARAKKLGKAKLTAIAERIKRSRPRR